MTIGAPPQNYTIPRNTQKIAPSWHIGPRAYNAAGIIPHPLTILGVINPVAAIPGILAPIPSAVHPFTINGRSPG